MIHATWLGTSHCGIQFFPNPNRRFLQATYTNSVQNSSRILLMQMSATALSIPWMDSVKIKARSLLQQALSSSKSVIPASSKSQWQHLRRCHLGGTGGWNASNDSVPRRLHFPLHLSLCSSNWSVCYTWGRWVSWRIKLAHIYLGVHKLMLPV